MRHRKFVVTLPLLTLALAGAAKGQENYPVEDVRGVLVMHWEYPNFVRQDGAKERVFEIKIEDTDWREKNIPKFSQESMLTALMFCVSAQGYENLEKLGDTGRATFVFTTIRSSFKVNAKKYCAGHATAR